MNKPRPITLTEITKHQLNHVSTATLTSQLIKAGYRNTFMTGIYPLIPASRLLGYAVTLRFVPAREDLIAATTTTNSLQRQAVEGVGPDDVLVIEARGEIRGAVIGDILAMRMKVLGAAGVVTDGALRDSPACAAIGWPIYIKGVNANRSNLYHYPAGRHEIISCGGIMVVPGDIIVGDGEGVVAIPPHVVADIAAAAYEQEQREAFILELVKSGRSSLEVYPANPTIEAEFQQWRQSQDR